MTPFGDHREARSTLVPLRRTFRAAMRGHRLQLWLIAAAIVVIAGLVAVSITTLRAHADRARQVQLIVAEIDANAQRISRVEWQAAAGPGLSRELAALKTARQDVDDRRRIPSRM